MEASAIPPRANRYGPNENTPRPLCGLSPVQRAPVGAKSGALRASVSRSAHSCTIATSGASADNASILRWKPDPQFQDTMRILATDTKSRHEQECAQAVIRISFFLEECILCNFWCKKLERV